MSCLEICHDKKCLSAYIPIKLRERKRRELLWPMIVWRRVNWEKIEQFSENASSVTVSILWCRICCLLYIPCTLIDIVISFTECGFLSVYFWLEWYKHIHNKTTSFHWIPVYVHSLYSHRYEEPSHWYPCVVDTVENVIIVYWET